MTDLLNLPKKTSQKPWPPAGIDWYYSDSHTAIACGDCRDILPDLPKVDLVLTDPPYGINEAAGKNDTRGSATGANKWKGSRNTTGVGVPSTKFDFSKWDKKPVNFGLLWELLTLGKSAICFGGNYYPMPSASKWLIWDKDNGDTDFADCELAWTNLPGAVRKFKYRWNGMLQENMKHKETRQYPTQKPVSLMRWCIEQAGNPQTILDPFMGSGTALRAAKDLNRQAIGIELSKKGCEIAVQRLKQEVLPL